MCLAFELKEVLLVHMNVDEIRIYPINYTDYPSEEYAKMCIANGFENHTGFYNLGNDKGYLNLYNKTLFLFQYNAKIIGKSIVYLSHVRKPFWQTAYYTDDIEVLDEPITAIDIKSIWGDFKKFNSVAQIIPKELLSTLLELIEKKKKSNNLRLGENESFCFSRTEGKKIEYYVTKYERHPVYREQAIKLHGLTCHICGFNFENKYGQLGQRYIEVHHKKPLYLLDEEIVPNPETDMICVCSNCHKMIHRYRDSIVSPEELIIMLNKY